MSNDSFEIQDTQSTHLSSNKKLAFEMPSPTNTYISFKNTYHTQI